MEYPVICLVSLSVAALTLFSGFGLGTLLLPAFAAFFPLPVAVAATAIVHLANNLFKVSLVGKGADRGALVKFGLPAVVAAFLGALTLEFLDGAAPLATYRLGGAQREITVVKLLIGALIVAFAVYDLAPRFSALTFDRKYLAAGGLLSGFFGGLSGHQGALRSAFLIKAGLSKEAFIATGVLIAVMIDVARLGVYVAQWRTLDGRILPLVAAAAAAAFVGSFFGARLIKKITLAGVQKIVGATLVFVGLGMAAGLL
jgi:uncharacterized protein